MSGPKVSQAELDRMRREAIAEQRRLNESILKEALANIRKVISEAKSSSVALGKYQVDAIKRLDEIERRYVSEAKTLSSSGYPNNPDDASRFNSGLKTQLKERKQALGKDIAEEVASWGRDIRGLRELEALNEFASTVGSIANTTQSIEFGAEKVAQLLNSVKGKSKPATNTDNRANLLEKAAERIVEMQSLILSEAVPVAKKQVLLETAREINTALEHLDDSPSGEIALSNALAASKPAIDGLRRLRRRMQDLYDLCECEAQRIAELTGQAKTIPPLSKFCGEADLNNLYKEFHDESVKASEEAYIAYVIDKVMEEHGYDVKKSVRLSATPNTMHNMYMDSFSDVGIHSYIAANGTVMMEIASIDNSVRACDEGQVVERQKPSSHQECARLVEHQKSFCELFPELVEDMAKYGVIVDKKSDKEPSEEHAVAFSVAGASTEGESPELAARRARGQQITVEQEREMK